MNLKEKIRAGKFILTAELGPPLGAGTETVIHKASYFREGIDGVNITDNQTAIVRMSSIAAAKILIEQGLEPVVQMTCRDRNRIALQSDILGMSAMGIENVLCLTGDHQRFGDNPEARGVFDLDSIQLIAMARRMADGFFLSGKEIKTPPRLCIGGVANPFAPPFEMRLLRLEKKIVAGAVFIQTQPVYDLAAFRVWMAEVRRRRLHEHTAILAGVMPMKSAKGLWHMKKEVPGSRVPDQVIGRMETADNPAEEGVKIAVETMLELKRMEGIRGIHLMPLLWESITPRLVKEAGFISNHV